MVALPETAANRVSSRRRKSSREERLGAALPDLATFAGGKTANVGFDRIERGNADKGLRGRLRLDLVELPAYVAPTEFERDVTVLSELRIGAVAIDLQDAAQSCEMPGRPHRRLAASHPTSTPHSARTTIPAVSIVIEGVVARNRLLRCPKAMPVTQERVQRNPRGRAVRRPLVLAKGSTLRRSAAPPCILPTV